jgi:hypothetical protein
MPFELHEDVCLHPQARWAVDRYGMQFQCERCGKLMGDLAPDLPGYADRVIALWLQWAAAGRPGFKGARLYRNVGSHPHHLVSFHPRGGD